MAVAVAVQKLGGNSHLITQVGKDAFGDKIIETLQDVRLPLWEDHDFYYETLQTFLPRAHVVKVSDEELSFVTRQDDEAVALKSLFVGNVEAIIYTKGNHGASLIFKDGSTFEVPTPPAQVVDTTGAGDAFIGAINAKLCQFEQQPIDTLRQHGRDILKFAHQVSGRVAIRRHFKLTDTRRTLIKKPISRIGGRLAF